MPMDAMVQENNVFLCYLLTLFGHGLPAHDLLLLLNLCIQVALCCLNKEMLLENGERRHTFWIRFHSLVHNFLGQKDENRWHCDGRFWFFHVL
jgi:hypothetical protein